MIQYLEQNQAGQGTERVWQFPIREHTLKPEHRDPWKGWQLKGMKQQSLTRKWRVLSYQMSLESRSQVQPAYDAWAGSKLFQLNVLFLRRKYVFNITKKNQIVSSSSPTPTPTKPKTNWTINLKTKTVGLDMLSPFSQFWILSSHNIMKKQIRLAGRKGAVQCKVKICNTSTYRVIFNQLHAAFFLT